MSQMEKYYEDQANSQENRGFIHGVFDACEKRKYNPDNDFQKIPKEEFDSGISDWSAGYQAGLIKGREQSDDRWMEMIDKFVKEIRFKEKL